MEPVPANTKRWPNVGLLLAHRLRRWPNIDSKSGQCLVFPETLIRYKDLTLSAQGPSSDVGTWRLYALPPLFIWGITYISRALSSGTMPNMLTLAEPYIGVFEQITDKINSTRIVKMFCGRCLVNPRIPSLFNLIFTVWRRIFWHKYNNFSSFGAGNCVGNSSSKWIKNSPKQFCSIKVNGMLFKRNIHNGRIPITAIQMKRKHIRAN